MRPRYTPSIAAMTLYVPKPGSLSSIKERSAIVGVPAEDGKHVRCYYEGGIYNPNMPFDEKLASACGRLAERYPTSAVCYAKPDQITAVGTVRYDDVLRTWIISELSDVDALEAWTGEHHTIGGSRDQHERAAGMIIQDGDTSAMVAWQMANQAKQDPVEAIINHARSKS